MKNVDIVFVFVDVKAKCCFVAERNNFVEQQLKQNLPIRICTAGVNWV